MGLFSSFSSRKVVSPHDFKHDVRNKLFSKGLSHRDIERFSEVADAALNEGGLRRGIDRHEKEQLVRVLRDHKSVNYLSDRQIDIIDKTLEEEL